MVCYHQNLIRRTLGLTHIYNPDQLETPSLFIFFFNFLYHIFCFLLLSITFFSFPQKNEYLIFHSCLTKNAIRQQRIRCHYWGSYQMHPFLLFLGLFLEGA